MGDMNTGLRPKQDSDNYTQLIRSEPDDLQIGRSQCHIDLKDDCSAGRSERTVHKEEVITSLKTEAYRVVAKALGRTGCMPVCPRERAGIALYSLKDTEQTQGEVQRREVRDKDSELGTKIQDLEQCIEYLSEVLSTMTIRMEVARGHDSWSEMRRLKLFEDRQMMTGRRDNTRTGEEARDDDNARSLVQMLPDQLMLRDSELETLSKRIESLLEEAAGFMSTAEQIGSVLSDQWSSLKAIREHAAKAEAAALSAAAKLPEYSRAMLARDLENEAPAAYADDLSSTTPSTPHDFDGRLAAGACEVQHVACSRQCLQQLKSRHRAQMQEQRGNFAQLLALKEVADARASLAKVPPHCSSCEAALPYRFITFRPHAFLTGAHQGPGRPAPAAQVVLLQARRTAFTICAANRKARGGCTES